VPTLPDWADQIPQDPEHPRARHRAVSSTDDLLQTRTRTTSISSLDRRELAAIFLGGAVGALLRVWLGEQFTGAAATWPWVTFSINVSGSFVLGYLATRLQDRLPPSTYRYPLFGSGFCGAYTTFSTMQVEILGMLEHGHYGLAAGYAAASVTAGSIAIWVATATVRRAQVIV
jgi:CrcB protein